MSNSGKKGEKIKWNNFGWEGTLKIKEIKKRESITLKRLWLNNFKIMFLLNDQLNKVSESG